MKVKADPKKMVLTVFRQRGGEELLVHQAEMERGIVIQANQALEIADLGPAIRYPSIDERVTQLQDGLVALVDGKFEDFYTRQYVKNRLRSDWNQVRGYVGLSPEAWESQKETIRETWEDAGMDSDDPVDDHLRGVHGVGKEEFAREIVHQDSDSGDTLERFLAGDPYFEDAPVFTGLRTARQALEYALDSLEE